MATLRSATTAVLKQCNKLESKSSVFSMTRSLTTPAKVVHCFDWKKSTGNLLLIRVTKQSIECGIASHPSIVNSSIFTNSSDNEESIKVLPSIPLEKSKASSKHPDTFEQSKVRINSPSFNVAMVTNALQQTIHQYNVCGVVVTWPTEQLEGWNGASCGRTLHVLDHIAVQQHSSGSNGRISNKPICLYDPNHRSDMIMHDDEWGRNPIYSITTKAKVVHCAKQQQDVVSKTASKNIVLEHVWENFCNEYWPNHKNDPIEQQEYGRSISDEYHNYSDMKSKYLYQPNDRSIYNDSNAVYQSAA